MLIIHKITYSRNSLSLLFLCLFSTLLSQDYQYPVRSLRITSHFGESRGDHFHTGTDFAGVQEIYPIGQGELLYSRDFYRNPTLPILGTGNLAVVQHEDGLRSFYYHLESGTLVDNKKSLARDDALGTMGDSGHSLGSHLHFSIEEKRNGTLVNPLDYLPEYPDDIPPEIRKFIFIINEKLYPIKSGSRFNYKIPFSMVVICADQRPGIPHRNISPAMAVGIERLVLTIDGEVYKDLNFSEVKLSEGGYVINNRLSHNEVFGYKHNYKLGHFTPNKNSHLFEITIYDGKGLSTSKRYYVGFR